LSTAPEPPGNNKHNTQEDQMLPSNLNCISENSPRILTVILEIQKPTNELHKSLIFTQRLPDMKEKKQKRPILGN
jgi:hypothetical protein